MRAQNIGLYLFSINTENGKKQDTSVRLYIFYFMNLSALIDCWTISLTCA